MSTDKRELNLLHRAICLLLSHSVMSDSGDPMDCSLPGSPVHGISQTITNYTGVGCHFSLQGVFMTRA